MRKRLLIIVVMISLFLVQPFGVGALVNNDEIVFNVSNSDELLLSFNEINEKYKSGKFRIELQNDIDLANHEGISGELNINKDCTVTILGNGHSIVLKSNTQDLSTFICAGGHLILGNKDGNALTVKVGQNKVTTSTIIMISSGVVDMYDGVVLMDNHSQGSFPGAVRIDKGTFNMYGGTIKDCSSMLMPGGAVWIMGGSSFNMYNGTIENCVSEGQIGGAICLMEGSHFDMYGGTIRNNEAKFGGAIALFEQSQFGMHGGLIERNKGTYGTIYLSESSNFNMENGLIKDNNSQIGGALFSSGSDVTIDKGKVIENNANVGGGFYLDKLSSLEMTKNAILCNNQAKVLGADLVFDKSSTIKIDSAVNNGQVFKADQEGKHIDGWYNDDVNQRYVPNAKAENIDLTHVSGKEMALIASYRIKHKLVYHLNGGTLDINDPLIEENGNIVQYAVNGAVEKTNNPIREGYDFKGWFLEDGTQFDFTTNIDKDLHLYAKWQKQIIIQPMTPIIEPPIIEAFDKVLYVGDKFDALKDVKAYDSNDGDLIHVLSAVSNVDTSKVGTYKVEYSVVNSSGVKVYKTINVIVKDKEIPMETDKDIIETGDDSNLSLWLGLGAFAIVALLILRKKK